MEMGEYITEWVDGLPDLKRGKEIVRCRDCAWFDPYTDEDTDGYCIGACWYFSHNPKINSDGFCYWAVKNEMAHNHA